MRILTKPGSKALTERVTQLQRAGFTSYKEAADAAHVHWRTLKGWVDGASSPRIELMLELRTSRRRRRRHAA